MADAWTKSREELQTLQEALQGNHFEDAARGAESIRTHLGFMRNRSVLFTSERKSQLDHTVDQASRVIDSLTTACSARDSQAAQVTVQRLRNALSEVGTLYPPDALDPGSPKALVMSGLPAPSVSIEILDASLHPHQPTRVRFRLRMGNGKPVTPGNLVPHQEHLLHALLLDPAFRDYHHQHPTPTTTPGEYEFTFEPRENSNYRMWINLVAMPFALEEFPYIDLLTPTVAPALQRTTNTVAITEAGRAELSWVSGLPIAGLKSRLKVKFFSPDGQPRDDLETFMGAFAHLVGFSEDYRSLLHIHPVDESLASTSVAGLEKKGGPELEFVFIVPKQGYMRLFVQTQVGGKPVLFAFGFEVRTTP